MNRPFLTVRGLGARILARLHWAWAWFWMRWAGLGRFGRLATRLATWLAPPYKARCYLAELHPRGYIAPSARIQHAGLRLGTNVFIGDRVVIYQEGDGGPVELGERVQLYSDIFIEVGPGGSLEVGANTTVQPRCQFTAYEAPIKIGRRVQIAPNCAFYPYDHGTAPHKPIGDQPLSTKGGIIVADDAWLGVGVIVLSGVRVGQGAVVGAGAVVTRDIPDGAVAAGVPARILRMRGDQSPGVRGG